MKYGSFEFGNEETTDDLVDQVELEKLARQEKMKQQEAEDTKKKAEKAQAEKDAKSESTEEKKQSFFDSEKSDKEGSDESEADAQDQRHAMAKEYLAIRTEELRAELAGTEVDSPEAAELLADLDLLTTLNGKLDNPDMEVDPAVEAAYQQILEQLGEVPSEVDKESPAATIDTITEDGNVASDSPVDIHVSHESRVLSQEEHVIPAEAGISKKPDPRPTHTVGQTDGSEPGMTATIDSSSSVEYSSGSNNQSVTSSQSSAGGPSPQNQESRAASAQAIEKTPPRSRAASVLIAGAVGTMLSRGGSERVTTSDKKVEAYSTPTAELSPSTDNIPERKINPVRRTIAEKERTIRSIALKQAVETAPLVAQSAEAAPALPPASFEKPPVPIEQMQPVHIDQALRPRPLSKEVVRSVEQSSTEELLQVANKIHVEGTTVRKLYEANKIDHRGLMAIVKESLRGGDIKRAYKKARLGAEAQQGRKIEMRHDDPAFIPADVRPEISDYGKKRVQTISKALEAAQHSTSVPAEARTQSSTPTPANHGYQQVKSAMRKKRIATITISATLALSGAAAIAWFLFG